MTAAQLTIDPDHKLLKLASFSPGLGFLWRALLWLWLTADTAEYGVAIHHL